MNRSVPLPKFILIMFLISQSLNSDVKWRVPIVELSYREAEPAVSEVHRGVERLFRRFPRTDIHTVGGRV